MPPKSKPTWNKRNTWAPKKQYPRRTYKSWGFNKNRDRSPSIEENVDHLNEYEEKLVASGRIGDDSDANDEEDDMEEIDDLPPSPPPLKRQKTQSRSAFRTPVQTNKKKARPSAYKVKNAFFDDEVNVVEDSQSSDEPDEDEDEDIDWNFEDFAPPTQEMDQHHGFATAADIIDVDDDDATVDLTAQPLNTDFQGKRVVATIQINSEFRSKWSNGSSSRTCEQVFHEYCMTLVDEGVLVYYVAGQEEGEKTGNPHMQCFFYFAKNIRQNKFLQMFTACYARIAKGTNKQAADYCKKGTNWSEYGVLPSDRSDNGKREKVKWEEVRQLVSTKESWVTDEKIPAHLMLTGCNSLVKYRELSQQARKVEDLPHGGKVGLWLHGESRSGKSSLARREYPTFIDKMPNKWGNSELLTCDVTRPWIIEDVHPQHVRDENIGDLLKRWADVYAFTVEIKGSTVRVRPSRVIVTSNYAISEMGFDNRDLEPLYLRFEEREVKRAADEVGEASGRANGVVRDAEFIDPKDAELRAVYEEMETKSLAIIQEKAVNDRLRTQGKHFDNEDDEDANYRS